jgi:hypothetical protein
MNTSRRSPQLQSLKEACHHALDFVVRGDVTGLTLLLSSFVRSGTLSSLLDCRFGSDRRPGGVPLLTVVATSHQRQPTVQLPLLQIMLSIKADPNEHTYGHETPLSLLCGAVKPNLKAIKELLHSGADPNLQAEDTGFNAVKRALVCTGTTAFDAPLTTLNVRVLGLLLQHSQKPIVTTTRYGTPARTALQIAAFSFARHKTSSDAACVAMLLRHGWSSGALSFEDGPAKPPVTALQMLTPALRKRLRNGLVVLPETDHPCDLCGFEARDKCGRCRRTRYCGKACQLLHWRTVHRNACGNKKAKAKSKTESKAKAKKESVEQRASQ